MNVIAFAADTVTEFIAFATAILTLTVTFSKGTFLADRTSPPIALGVSWIMYLLCVFFGIWTLMALTGEAGSANGHVPNIYGENVTIPAGLMVISFVVGVIFTTVADFKFSLIGD